MDYKPNACRKIFFKREKYLEKNVIISQLTFRGIFFDFPSYIYNIILKNRTDLYNLYTFVNNCLN